MGVLRLAEPGGMKTLAKGQLHAKHNHNDDLSSDFGRGQWELTLHGPPNGVSSCASRGGSTLDRFGKARQ